MGKQIKEDNDLKAILKKSDDLEAMLKRCDDLESALEDDDLFKAVLEEQFMKEAEAMERAIFADEDFEDYDASDEEVHASYEKLVARLKADGVYREEVASEKIIPMPTKREPREKALPPSAKKLLRNAGYTVPEEISSQEDSGEKKTERKKKRTGWQRFGKVAGMVVLCTVCVFAASMTSEGNRKYFVNNIRILTGNDTKIMVDNDAENEPANGDEYKAIQEIEKKIGVEVPEFLYRPYNFEFIGYEVNQYSKIARLEYQYEKNIILVYIDKEDTNSGSKIDSLHGDDITTISIPDEDINVAIEKIDEDQEGIPNYSAQWERDDVIYIIRGKIELKELKKIIEDIVYLE